MASLGGVREVAEGAGVPVGLELLAGEVEEAPRLSIEQRTRLDRRGDRWRLVGDCQTDGGYGTPPTIRLPPQR